MEKTLSRQWGLCVCVASVGLFGALLSGCSSNSGQSVVTNTDHLRSATPTEVQVKRRDIVGYAMIQGQLYVPASAEAFVKAPYSASVQELTASAGQRVRKGDLILKMSLPDQQQYLQQAQLNYKAAQTAYSSAQATYGGDLRKAQQALADARSTERTLRDQASQGTTGGDLQDAISARQQAEEAVIQAKSAQDQQLLPYKQQLDAANLSLRDARSGARQANVTAPIEGTLVEVRAQSGQALTGGAEVAHIVDLDDLLIKADLTPDQANFVDKDRKVAISFAGIPNKSFSGRVSGVRTFPDGANGVKREATITFTNDDGMVKPGVQPTSVGVQIGQVKDAISVPNDAIFRDQAGKPCVRVKDKEKGDWVVKMIEIGMSDGFFTEVKAGLDEGDTVQEPGSTS